MISAPTFWKGYLATIMDELRRFSIIWDVKMNDERLLMLGDAVFEEWKHESILDVCKAIRDGSNGKYGTTYRNLDPGVIGEWMVGHLEQKAVEREKVIQNREITNEPLTGDMKEIYEEYKNRPEDPKEKKRKEDFNNFKMQYLHERKKGTKHSGESPEDPERTPKE
jgi:hypothetical protein